MASQFLSKQSKQRNLAQDGTTVEQPESIDSPRTPQPDYQTPTFTEPLSYSESSPFYCSAEYHLARMSRMAATLHPWALRLAGDNRWFSASAPNAAKYLNSNHKSIRTAIKDLVRAGFFELVEQGTDKPSIYRVLNHKDWAEKHPGLCVQKTTYIWDGEGDKIAQWISARTAFKVKLQEFQVRQLRKTGLSDEAILELFDEHRSLHPYQNAHNVFPSFITAVRRISNSPIQ
jgi:hypothetical protein